MVDLSKIKPGDEVTVRAIVSDQIHDKNWGLHFKHLTGLHDGCAKHFVHPDCIASHTPAVRVGDRVKNTRCAAFSPGYAGGEVMAIADGWAMVRFCETPGIVKLSELERIDV